MNTLTNSQKEDIKPESSINNFSLETGPLMTVQDVANYLRVTPATVRGLAKQGKLQAMKVGRMWRFQRGEVLKYIARR